MDDDGHDTSKDGVEKRAFKATGMRISRDGDGGSPMIVGHAAVYDSWSEPLWGGMFREMIAAGAFTKTLSRKPDVRALHNHSANQLLGRTLSNTLRLSEDKRGLAIEVDPPDTRLGEEILHLIERGDIDAMSFAFWIPDGGDQWSKSESDDVLEDRVISEIELDGGDVSTVTYPAYQQTDVSLRGAIPASRQAWIDKVAAEQAGVATRTDAMARRMRMAEAQLRQPRI